MFLIRTTTSISSSLLFSAWYLKRFIKEL